MVARDIGILAALRDQRRRIEWPIAVDHKARIDLSDGECTQALGQLTHHARSADIPADVAHAFALGQTKITEHARDAPAGVIAGQKKRRDTAFAFDGKRYWLVRSTQHGRR